MAQIVVVHLRITDGSTFPIRCKGIAKNPLVPGQLILIECIDDVPTSFGPVKNGNWSINAGDIGNYVIGEMDIQESKELPDIPEEDEDTEEVFDQLVYKNSFTRS